MNIIKLTLVLCIAIRYGDAYAICQDRAGCYVADDTPVNPICLSDPYDPCDYWMLWDVYFTRTAQTGSPATLHYWLENAYWSRSYSSQNYSAGNYHFNGSYYIGPSTGQRIHIERIGTNTGNFTNISLQLEFVADDPD
jgi:hypothetical protein